MLRFMLRDDGQLVSVCPQDENLRFMKFFFFGVDPMPEEMNLAEVNLMKPHLKRIQKKPKRRQSSNVESRKPNLYSAGNPHLSTRSLIGFKTRSAKRSTFKSWTAAWHRVRVKAERSEVNMEGTTLCLACCLCLNVCFLVKTEGTIF